MPDLSAIGAAITGLQSISSSLVSVINAKGQIDFQSKAIELQSVIINAQSSAMDAQRLMIEMSEKIRQLEDQIKAIENWNKDSEGFRLVEIRNGNFAYVSTEASIGTSGQLYYCPVCFGNRKLSIMQKEVRQPGQAHVVCCHSCGNEIYTSGVWMKEHGARSRR